MACTSPRMPARHRARIGLEDSKHIGRVLVDPRDANVVYVAALGHAYGPNAERGVFKSSDGGRTWRKVLYRGPDVGAIDLAFEPGMRTCFTRRCTTCGARRGAPMRRSRVRAAGFINRPMAARPGVRSRAAACPRASGDAWASPWRRTGPNACTCRLTRETAASSAPMTRAQRGRAWAPIRAFAGACGISAESRSTRTTRTCCMFRMFRSISRLTGARRLPRSRALREATIITRSGSTLATLRA